MAPITKTSQQRRWIACNRPDAAGPDTGELCSVGGIWFPECLSLLCSGRCPRQLTWASICPEGHEVLAHLSASWRQGDMAWGGCNATAPPCLHNECCPQWALALCAKVERKFPDEVCFWTENWGFIYSFVWYVPLLWAEFPIQTWLFSSQHEHSLPQGRKRFPSNSTAAAAAAYTSDSHALLYIITT